MQKGSRARDRFPLGSGELILQLLESKKLQLKNKVDVGKIVFHDSCYLGRYNNIFEQPRKLIEAATGKAVRYTIFTDKEFRERREIGDKFLYGLFEAKHLLPVNHYNLT